MRKLRGPLPLEHRMKISASMVGRKRSPEAVAKTVASKTGMRYNWTPSGMERNAAAHRGEKNFNWKGGVTKLPGYDASIFHKRAALIRGTGGQYTSTEWNELLAKSGNKCLSCGSNKRITADHVIPVSKGGKNTIENIQPLCLSCNVRKYTKDTDYRIKV